MKQAVTSMNVKTRGMGDMFSNIIIKLQGVHDLVHDWFLQPCLLSCTYESRPAYFYQGLSPEQKPQNPAYADAFHPQPSILDQDERPTLAQRRQARVPHAPVNRPAQVASKIRLNPPQTGKDPRKVTISVLQL
jgi:hypothetical protein